MNVTGRTEEGTHLIRSIRKPIALLAAILLLAMSLAPVAAVIEAEEAFYNTWARTDMPVSDGTVSRTWMWGPEPNTEVIAEPYAEHPIEMRPVQYFDKARMEVNNPNIEYDGLWYVTNGLLVVELMDGNIQVGDFEFIDHGDAADIQIAGDPDQPDTPTYATYADLRDTPAFADGAVNAATVDADGNVGMNASLEAYGVTAGPLSPETGHRTASVFWDFMTSSGIVWDWETDAYTTGLLFQNPYYATGLPITEAYWANIFVDGTQKWVLTQAFERRVLTYTPDNDPGWQVEAGNVGQHYYQWRYGMTPPPPAAQSFHVFFGALNDSGVGGMGMLTLEDGMLTVEIEATGLEANEEHMMHIHGFEDFQQSLCPTPDMAGDDGLISITDGGPAYGGVALPLTPYMVAEADGTISFSETYAFDVSSEILVAHTIVIHGLTVGEAYDATLPVACGAIIPDAGFYAELTGEAELPVPIETDGSGFATFHVPADDMALTFTLVVYGLDEVTMAHIHIEAEDGLGPVAVFLFDERPDGITANGIIASATFTDADLIGPAAGWSIQELIAAIDAGTAYVNVHTAEYPAGEIRGTIHRVTDVHDEHMQ
jgi:hypothetical protein